MNKLYDLLKYIIYASFYVIVIKTGMDFYEYKRFPKLYESYSSPWYTETLLYIAASLFVIVVCFVLRVILGRKMKSKGQILRSTPNTAPLICGAYNTQPEGLSTMA